MLSKYLIFSLLLVSMLFSQSSQNLKKSIKDRFEKAKRVQNNTSVTTKMTIAQATLKAINDVRAKKQICSKPTNLLRWNAQLYVYAKEHSIDMAVTNKLSHDGSGTKTDKTAIRLNLNRGSHFYERVNQQIDSKKILSGEVIIRSSKTLLKGPKELINYWVKNPKDCKVIMDSRFSDVALAKVISNKDNKSYWTLLLAGARKK